jgi:hypothetical protein
MRTFFVFGLAVSVFFVACGNSGGGRGSQPSSVTDGGSQLSADGGGQNDGAGAADGCSAEPITSPPADWVRPADCGGIGNLCSQGCGSAECQLFGQVCEPGAGVGASPTSCAPYCLAYDCMTFEQASCFCTGDAGSQDARCACGPAAVLGLCAAEGVSCATTPCCECQGLKCVTDSVSGTVCRQPCSQNADCATGCCDTSTGVCHDGLYCNCADAGSTCAGAGPNCCPGTTCLSFSGDGGGPYSCYQTCSQNADCATGCCNTSSGLCQDALDCVCLPAGATCGDSSRECCSATVCVSFAVDGGGPYACAPTCTKQSDCSSGCCSQPIPGFTYGACGPCN